MDWSKFFHVFITSKEVFLEFCDIIPEGIFNNPIQSNILILVKKFKNKHSKAPDFDSLLLLLEQLPDSELSNKQAYVDFIEQVRTIIFTPDIDVFKEELTRTVQQHEIEQFVLKVANNTRETTLESMLEGVRAIAHKFTPKSTGIDVGDVDRNIKTFRHDTTTMMPSGIEELDRILRGGYGSNEITIVMAPPGKGKSFFLVNAMYYALLGGHNALYVTLELGEKSVIRRLYSRLSFANRKDMLEEAVIAKRAYKFFKLVGSTGRVVYYPGLTLTVTGLEALLEQQQLYFNFKPDILIVDYLDRLAPRKADYRSEVRHQLRNITDDLRSLATRNNIAVLTATQCNRASLSKLKITEANVSESFGKVEVADVILALCQTDEERAAKRARLAVLKNRENTGGNTLEFYVDFDKMMLADLASAQRLGLIEVPKQIMEIKTRKVGGDR